MKFEYISFKDQTVTMHPSLRFAFSLWRHSAISGSFILYHFPHQRPLQVLWLPIQYSISATIPQDVTLLGPVLKALRSGYCFSLQRCSAGTVLLLFRYHRDKEVPDNDVYADWYSLSIQCTSMALSLDSCNVPQAHFPQPASSDATPSMASLLAGLECHL